MSAKQPNRRLPFEVANATSRPGRPRAPRVMLACSRCGSDFERYASAVAKSQSKRVFCSTCYHLARKGGLNPRRPDTQLRELDRLHNGHPVRIDRDGYIAIYDPSFAAAPQKRSLPKGYHYEHTVVGTRMIRRPLRRNEVVHHDNEIKSDNHPANLMVITRSEHTRIHEARRADEHRELAEYKRRFGPLNVQLVKVEHWLPVTALQLEDVEKKRPN